MDYKEKYEMALERAKNLHKDAIDMGETLRAKQCEIIFPELAESGDEKVRKTIIRFFKDNYPNETQMYDGTVTVGKAIAWLEKQESVEEIVARCKDSWYNEGKIAGMAEGLTDDEKYQQGWHDALEKQCEKFINETDEEIVKAVKDTSVLDMVESKLHKGEWIISNNGDCVGQIIDYGGDNFFWCEHTNGYFSGYFKKDYHLWTIQDAKDGDVLVNGSNIFIFRFLNDTRLMGYCHVNTNDGRFYDDIGKNECFCLIDAAVTPATKEQRDLLFQKMKEAGYEWDVENKELKKIEQEDEEYNGEDYGIDSLYHAISILEKTLGEVEGYQSDDGILEHKCAITAVKELYKKKPAELSEEDKKMIDILIKIFETHYSDLVYPVNLEDITGRQIISSYDIIKWLKLLKERINNENTSLQS